MDKENLKIVFSNYSGQKDNLIFVKENDFLPPLRDYDSTLFSILAVFTAVFTLLFLLYISSRIHILNKLILKNIAVLDKFDQITSESQEEIKTENEESGPDPLSANE